MLGAYRALTSAAAPLAPLLLGYRQRRGKEDPARIGERLGRAGAPRPAGPLVWFHAASVGETNAILPLIGSIRERRPDLTVLLTTGTVTSARLAAARLPEGAIHQFLPLDVPSFVQGFLEHWRPDLGVFTESEIWPNLVLGAARRGVPLLLVNARLSDRSYSRWRQRPRTSAALFGRFELVLAQNDETAARFGELGAPKPIAVGNLKIDAPPPPADRAELGALRRRSGDRPVLLAASTHPGEDELVIEAHRAIVGTLPNLLTIVVPRHPERAAAVAALFAAGGLSATRRSADDRPDLACDAYIADTIGELGLFYALAPVSFVGGSLVPHGGQNPVEAVKHGSAVLTGPHHHNFDDAYRALLGAKGCAMIRSAADLAGSACGLLEDETARALMQARARDAIAGLSGALARTLDALNAHLPAPGSARRAS